ncbi:Type I restriction-modification system, specificity subunit S [Candidatus Arthromitus sp. SFB-mouse-NL]|nr:restriction endonuclease subunit S [Candidatus Arthromitus sp. SFB-mouse-NL]AID45105.1 Type I restriction-modification system, specificity subunit S [Candidatus Arthromitus sp. SFB-mouse-NL]
MMSKIEELIERLCPDGVEWKELGEVANFRRGAFPQPYGNAKWYGGENSMPFVQVADVDDNFNLVANTRHKISTIAIEKSVFVKRGTVIVTLQGTIGRVAITQYDCYIDRTLALFQDYKIDINKKYFAYQLKQKFDYEKKTARGSTLKTITKEEFTKFKIPIPPLEIQEEIVHILDSFTELTAELTARKKQYEFYRDSLLTFGDEVERVKLKDVAIKLFRGNGIKRDDLTNDGTPCVRYGEIYTEYGIHFEKCKSFTNENQVKNKKYIEYGDILFAITGESVEEIGKSTAYIGNEKVLAGGDILILKHNQNPKYLSYFLSTEDAKKQKMKGKVKSKVVHTNAESIGNILIPLPPLPEQERIVSILDKFDKLCNDISEGLPAEIDERKKQYEYYRDKLLTFKELEK